MSRKDHQYLINCIQKIYDAFSFENLKHLIRKIKYQFWGWGGWGSGKFRGFFLLKNEKKKKMLSID